jgi:hypothetical protein
MNESPQREMEQFMFVEDSSQPLDEGEAFLGKLRQFSPLYFIPLLHWKRIL